MVRYIFKTKFISEPVKFSNIMKDFHIRPVKKIHYAFDPYTSNTSSIRDVMAVLNSKNVLRTSVAKTKIDIRSDRCSPQINVEFLDGHKLIFNTEHLKPSEIVEKLGIFCKAKDTAQPEADVQLSKMSGKPKRKK